ncbi:MAG: ParB/RepB/Spo0J family partition protein [Oscillospiraceae bacterium]|nr:ParB/RepB/Spo0J family partition protein [Oscillospiraceae bacterium]
MAKDTPNTPEDKTIPPTDEKLTQEQAVPGEVVISADKVNEIANNLKTAAQAAEQTAENEPSKEPEALVSEEQATPVKKGLGGRPPKNKGEHPGQDEKAADSQKRKPTPEEYKTRGQKAAETRKASRQRVDDFIEGKRTSPLPDGKAIPEKQRREARPPTGIPKEEPKPPEPVKPPEVKEAPRPGEKEEIVFLQLNELFPFKDHPFGVRDDAEMRAMVESVKDKGVTQPAIVRPREDGGYELVSGHRRQKASELAGYADMPCIVRNLTDEQAITQMVEDNTNQRESILPSERAKALKMQLDAIKRQGVRDGREGNGQRSNEIVAERNNMNAKQVQRYIKLNDLVPELLKMADEGTLKFTPAIELAFVSKKNQQYIAMTIESQQSTPNLSQAQRMRELDQKKALNPDVIDGIMLEEKKEADKVILSTAELSQYFGKEKTPREMKDTILALLDEYKAKQHDISAPEKKKNEQEK